jgi:type I restriction enzyme M protein
MWILTKDKSARQSPSPQTPLPEGEGLNQLRDRRGETLFIDARKIGSMISRTQKELDVDDIAAIARTYHAWRSGSGVAPAAPSEGRSKKGAAGATPLPVYADIPGYCKSAKLDEIRKHDYVLTPGRYVGAAPLEDDGIPFETKMTEMSQTLYAQMKKSAKLDDVIRKNLKGLGYGQ